MDFPGNTEQTLAKQVYRTTGKLPERIENAPRLLPGMQLYLTAFFDLDRERSIGFAGKEVIRSKAVFDYAEMHGFDAEQRSRLLSLIPKVDNAWLTRLEAKRPKQPTPPRRK